jgi:hypothetical protein
MDGGGGGGGFGGGGGGGGDYGQDNGISPGASYGDGRGDRDYGDRRGDRDYVVAGRPRNTTTLVFNTTPGRDRLVYVPTAPYIPTPVLLNPQPVVTTLPPPVIYQTQANAVTKPLDAPLTVEEWLLYSPARYPGYNETDRINLLPQFNANPDNIRDARVWFTKNRVEPQPPAAGAAPGTPGTFIVEPVPPTPEAAAAAAAQIGDSYSDTGSYVSGTGSYASDTGSYVSDNDSGWETDPEEEQAYSTSVYDHIRSHGVASQPRYHARVNAAIEQLCAHNVCDAEVLIADCVNAMLY